MSLFDLLFASLLLVGVGSLIVALIAALRGRGTRARVILRRVGVVGLLYAGILLVVSAFSPQRIVRMGEDQCSDDWCIAVQAVRRDSVVGELRYEVTFRLSSRARRVAQRERFVTAYVVDGNGHRYAPVNDANAIPFDTLLMPEQVIAVKRQFVVPAHAGTLGVVIAREGGGRFPGCCIIGDQESFFHSRAVVKLE